MVKVMIVVVVVLYFYYVEEIGVSKLIEMKCVLSEGVFFEVGVKFMYFFFFIKFLFMVFKKYFFMNSVVDEVVIEINV